MELTLGWFLTSMPLDCKCYFSSFLEFDTSYLQRFTEVETTKKHLSSFRR